jgi:hypothetical protein
MNKLCQLNAKEKKLVSGGLKIKTPQFVKNAAGGLADIVGDNKVGDALNKFSGNPTQPTQPEIAVVQPSAPAPVLFTWCTCGFSNGTTIQYNGKKYTVVEQP